MVTNRTRPACPQQLPPVMTITLNGEPFTLADSVTVSELLACLKIDGRRVAVELNLVVLKRHAFDTTTVNEGDEVEIVNFVGGG
jgi:sulfur carrier protein